MLVHILIVFFQTTSFVSEAIPVDLRQFSLHLAFVLLLSFQRERNVEETEACKVATATMERNSMLFFALRSTPSVRFVSSSSSSLRRTALFWKRGSAKKKENPLVPFGGKGREGKKLLLIQQKEKKRFVAFALFFFAKKKSKTRLCL